MRAGVPVCDDRLGAPGRRVPADGPPLPAQAAGREWLPDDGRGELAGDDGEGGAGVKGRTGEESIAALAATLGARGPVAMRLELQSEEAETLVTLRLRDLIALAEMAGSPGRYMAGIDLAAERATAAAATEA